MKVCANELSATSNMLGAERYLKRLDQLQCRIRMTKGKPFHVTPLIKTHALAASTVAKAGGYERHAFVPDTVEKPVARMLDERGAVVEIIPRGDLGEGDPCYLAFLRAIDKK